MNYYISDLHVGHYNAMVKFDQRPFKTLEEQDKAIIDNINNTVLPQDNLYLLGDVSWYKADKTIELLEQIKCNNLFLIVGNHDNAILKDSRCRSLFKGIYDLKRINDNGRIVILCHYPLAVWDQSHRGSIMLYGHVHHNLTDGECTHTILNHEEMKNAYNVGCMLEYMDFTPRTLDEIIAANKY